MSRVLGGLLPPRTSVAASKMTLQEFIEDLQNVKLQHEFACGKLRKEDARRVREAHALADRLESLEKA